MKILCIILVLIGSNLALHLSKSKSDLNNEMFIYLHKFGYLPNQITNSDNGTKTKEFKNGILQMQRNSHIPMTGLIDNQTIDMIRRPRCGVSDSTLNINRRHKRFTLLSTKWHRNDLTWHFDPKNPKFINHTDLIRKHITKALSEWSKYSNLTFTEIVSKDADIVLSFENRTHGDRKFDGNGGILAHSWYPGENLGGDVHFDEDEDWNFDEDGDFYPVTLHELGHSLGLRHSNEETDIMHVSPKKEISSLSRDDIQAIQDIYSKPTTDSQQKHQH
ncbi:unnamed protein product [Diamesa serratosioi]